MLVSGALPPPIGGVQAFYKSLLNSSLPDRVDLCFVRTSSQERVLASSGRMTISNLVSAVADCARFARAVLTHRPQISHIATAFGLSFVKHGVCVMIARSAGGRVLLHPHCSLSALYVGRPGWWRWLIRRIIGWTDGIVALSSEWDQLRSIVPGCRIYHLPNAIDLTPYRGIAEERVSHVGESTPLAVLYLGYVGKAKGSFDLLEAAREVRSRGVDASFDLVGDELTSGEYEQLRKRVDESGLNGHVRLHAAAYGSDKIAFLRKADVFVYPSYHEGMPIAVLEAMACGLPVVATRVGGLPDLVTDGANGLLVEPGKPDQLATALQKIFLENGLRRPMQRKSREIAFERYDIEQRVAQLVDIYKAALSEG